MTHLDISKLEIINTLRLLVPSPSPSKFIRIGGSGDGAYLIPDILEGVDACFSPGVNNFKNFEDELTDTYGIKCHMCDFSSDQDKLRTPLIKGMQTFKKKWLDIDGGKDSISLKEWVEELSPNVNKDLILQIDIEGAEYRNLLAADSHTLARFRIIVIELHGLGRFKNPELFSQGVGPLLVKLNETHLSIHAHPNNCCGYSIEAVTGLNIPNVIEVTYLRRDRFTGDQSQHIHTQLPHPLDISRNVRQNPPIHLNQNWLIEGKRSRESELKVLQDNLNYAEWINKQIKSSNSIDTEEVGLVFRQSIINLVRAVGTHALPPQVDGLDLAHGKKYFLSKAYGSYPREGCVSEDPHFFFHTAIEKSQSITIDLGESHELHRLVVSNRKDMCQERAKSLFYIVHDDRNFSVNDSLPVVVTEEFIKPNAPESVTPLFGIQGRYLTIFSPIHTALHFSCIRIFGLNYQIITNK